MTDEQIEARKQKARERTKLWYVANKEHALAYKAAYYSKPENIEHKKNYSRNYYQQNKERHRQQGKEWRSANPDRVRAISRRQRETPHYQENKIQWGRAWRREHKDHSNSYQRQVYAQKYRSDPSYRLRRVVRQRIRNFISSDGTSKTLQLLGCSLQNYRKYLEARFLPGMTWDNHTYNGWHIDHIKPISQFDLSNPQQLKDAFHYTNTQPLWYVDNIRKSNKLL